eukprot:Tbor_TRINITY_DN5258_c1_g2::TRINITY_DN5258_c1_g2_i1::g.16658::m.16658
MLHSIMKSPSFSVTRACKTSVGEVPMPTVSSSYLCTLVHGVSEGMLTPATPIMPSTAHYTLLQVSNSQSTHRQITNFRGYNNDIISRGGIVRLTRVLLQGERNFQKHYLHEAFVASKRLKESRDNYTYPGQLRAACPGETQYGPLSPRRFILSPHQRSYWRPVIDDIVVNDYITLRIRFKDNVWVTTGYEQRMHVIQVAVPRHATIKEVIGQVMVENNSPYLCQAPFHLVGEVSKDIAAKYGDFEGVKSIVLGESKVNDASEICPETIEGSDTVLIPLDPTKTVEALGLHDMSVINALDNESDHLDHLPERQLKDWHNDEITDEDLADKKGRYRDLGYPTNSQLKPRYQAKPNTKDMNFGRF